MGSHETHFEVFLKVSPRHDWRLLCARPSRDVALKEAHAALAAAPKGSVRVSKEVLDPETRTFRSTTVFQAGGDAFDAAGSQDEREPELPCTGPSDLVGLHAREAIAGALRSWLGREGVTPLELLHRVDLVERLEASNAEMQHAIQKIAIARAAEDDASVQQLVKQLYALVQAGVEQLYADTRGKLFPTLKPGDLAGLAARLTDRSDRERRLRGAIVGRLQGAKTWRAKLERILDIADEAAAIAEKMPWALGVVGEFMGEITRTEDARATLCEEAADRGDEAAALTALVQGDAADDARLSAVGARLAWHFSEDRFTEARSAVGARVLSVLKDPRRLKPHDVQDEIALVSALAGVLLHGPNPHLSPDEVETAFLARCGRLLQPELVDALASASADEGASLMALLELDAAVIGEANKSKLAATVRGRLSLHNVEKHFVYSDEPILHRLAELARLRQRLCQTALSPEDKASIAGLLDGFAAQATDAAQLFAKIESRALPALDRAAALLRLAANGVLPPGELTREARIRARKLLSEVDPHAMAGAGEEHTRTALSEIAALMAQLGQSEHAV